MNAKLSKSLWVIVSISALYVFSTSLFADINKLVSLEDRTLIFNALTKQGVLNNYRKLVHLTHVCNLEIDNEIYPVAEAREHVKGAQVPRGVNHVFILNSSLSVINKIPFDGSAFPLYCKNNQLFWYGYLAIDGLLPEGNILTFSKGGKKVVVSEMETNDFPVQQWPQ